MEIKISIIVPIYNVENCLEKCIKSLLNQKFKKEKYEIILINDGSTDLSDNICKKYIKIKNIRYIKIENRGCSYARNLGIKLSKGKYIMFVDSDDYVDENYILYMYNKIKEDNSDMVHCNYILENKKGKILKKRKRKISSNIEKFLIENDNCGYIWNKIFKKDIILQNNIFFPEKSHLYEDMIFIFKYCLFIKKISILDNKLYHYVYNENSVMNNISSERIKDIFYGLEDLNNYVKKTKKYKKIYNFIFLKRGINNSYSILENDILKNKNENYKKYLEYIDEKVDNKYFFHIFYWKLRIYLALKNTKTINYLKKIKKGIY